MTNRVSFDGLVTDQGLHKFVGKPLPDNQTVSGCPSEKFDSMAAVEQLPVGVGRVPRWWMEVTPHYTLDEEEAEARRLAEDQMDYYYMQLAAADEAGLLNPDGTPKEGVDMTSWTPSTPWNGRSANNKGGSNLSMAPTGRGGRNFQPGQPVIDPKIFGIYFNDPDYRAYLTGAKLPPGYFEKMGEFATCAEGGAQGILNNLKQTDYGRYGRQAEAPSFKPDWAKKKLRTTSTGANIRQGQYDDSPNKFSNRRRVQPSVEVPSLDDEPVTVKESSKPNTNTIVRTVRTVVRTDEPGDDSKPKPQVTTHVDYMLKAPPVVSLDDQNLLAQKDKLARLKELQRQQMLLKQQREEEERRNKPGEPQEDEYSYEEEIIEEVIDDDDNRDGDYSEGSYEEEIIEEDPHDSAEDDELNKLQAILAAKQAELQRLKSEM
jgi:hypothetical protein